MTERVERLLNEPRPARHSLGKWNLAALAAAALLFLPWGRAAAPAVIPASAKGGYHEARFWGRFFAAPDSALTAIPLGVPRQASSHLIWILDESRLERALAHIQNDSAILASDEDNAAKLLGGRFSYIPAPGSPSQTAVAFTRLTANNHTQVTGAIIRLSADEERWPENPFTLTATQLADGKTNLFELEASSSSGPGLLERIEIPPRGGVMIAEKAAGRAGQRQMMALALEKRSAMTGAPRRAPVEAASAAGTAPKEAPEPLLVRSYKLDQRIFPALEAQLKQPDGSPFDGGRMEMLREHLRLSGLRSFFEDTPLKADTLSPAAKALFYNERNGILLVRATSEEMARIDEVLHALSSSIPLSGGVIPQEPPAPAGREGAAIRIESGFLAASEELRARLVSGAHAVPASEGAAAWTVSSERFDEILRELKAQPSWRLAAKPALAIAPGQQAQITIGTVRGKRLAPFLGNTPESSKGSGNAPVHSVNATGYILSKDKAFSAPGDEDGSVTLIGSALHAKASLIQNGAVELDLTALITAPAEEPGLLPLRTNFLGSCRMVLRESAHVILTSEKKGGSHFILISARRDAEE